MKKRIFLVLFLIMFFLFPVVGQIAVFPTPEKVANAKGKFAINPSVKIEGNGEYARKLATDMSAELKKIDLPSNTNSGSIRLELDASCSFPAEGYSLQIKPDQILLKASSESGLFYACQTLLQLSRYENGELQCRTINDKPRYEWRGYMLDESRHFFGKEKVKQYIDILASLKMNIFHWHLTDEPGWRIEIKRYPKLTAIGGIGNYSNPNAPATYYTQDDIKEIVAYAAERHITVIPEFDMPGHATAVCRAYPEVSGGGEGRWEHFTFHPCKEETYEFISAIFDELFELFPSPYIHIGGDEVHYGNQSWFTDPEIQQFIKDKQLVNEVGLEHYFVRKIADMVASKGRTIIGWDEIVDAGVSPSKAVIMWWRHDRKYQLVKALENGFRVIMTPRKPLYGDFVQYRTHEVGRIWGGYNPIEDIYRFPDPIIHLTKGYEDQVMGMQMSMWTERIANERRLDYMTFPRLVAVAESAWTPERSKEVSLFMQKLPLFLSYLSDMGIYYFNPFEPDMTPEPQGPEKDDVIQNG